MEPFGDPLMNLWKRSGKKVLQSTPIFDLVSIDVTSPRTQKTKPYYVLETKSWVNVIAITPDQKIVLVRQYRHGLHEYCLELPGGVVDEEGLDAHLISAKRELAEETGYTAKEWKLLGKASGNPAVFNNWSYTYLALGAEKTQDVDWDEGEDIEIFLEPLDGIQDLIRNGTIHHSMMVAALGMYFFYGKK
ncbi:MAG: NUDIX hydrolase [Leptospira sp.]|jgi:ADP-ribose pyrophosphatase|nr:NUDIX hydrolase [Leptospira sp.]